MERNRKAERRRLVATMTRQERGIDDIAAEVARRERCGPLAAYRLVHDLSQEGAAERYNESLGVHIGDSGFMTRQRIGKLEAWPHGDITPTLSELVQLADMYGTEPSRLLPPDHLCRLPASVRVALQRGTASTKPGRTLDSPTTHLTDEVDDMHRRELLNVLAAAGIGASVPLDSIESLRGALTDAVGVSDSLEDWRTVVAHYAVTVPTTPPERLIVDLLPDLAEVSRLLRAGHPERIGLLEVAAQLSAYSAMALYDCGHPRTAFRWWDAARKTADAAGDPPLRAWIRAREGLDLLYGARLAGPALRLADEGVRIAHRHPSTGLAEVQTLRARALAATGDPDARGALDDLRRTADRLPDKVVADNASWAGFGENRIWGTEAVTYMWLKDTSAARLAANRAITTTPPEQGGSIAQLKLTTVAACMVLDGEIVDGLEYAVETLKAPPEPSLSVRNAGIFVLDALPEKARALPAAAELRELAYA